MPAPAVAVEWVVPAGAACPRREEVEAKVASLLRPGAGDIAARVVVRTTDGGVHLDIEQTGSHRELDVATCAEGADAAALILSLGDRSTEATVTVPSQPAPSQPAPPAPAATAPRPIAADASSPPWSLFAGGFVDSGSLAETSLGATVGVSRAVSRLEIGLGATFAAGVGGATDAAGHGARFDAVTGQLDAFLPFRFPTRVLTLGPVLGAEAGALFAKGSGVDHPASKTAGSIAALAAARGRVDLARNLALTVDLGLAVPFDRPSFYFSPASTDFARVAPVAFRGGVGLSFRFR